MGLETTKRHIPQIHTEFPSQESWSLQGQFERYPLWPIKAMGSRQNHSRADRGEKRMVDPYGGERMRFDEQRKPIPAEGLPLTAPVEAFEQIPGRAEHERLYLPPVIRHL